MASVVLAVVLLLPVTVAMALMVHVSMATLGEECAAYGSKGFQVKACRPHVCSMPQGRYLTRCQEPGSSVQSGQHDALIGIVQAPHGLVPKEP